jgi:hypothetical protein
MGKAAVPHDRRAPASSNAPWADLPLDMLVVNDLDRFHVVMDVISVRYPIRTR